MISFLMDNTGSALSSPMFREAIKDAILYHGGQLCEELSDLFILSPIVGNVEFPENAWRIDWA